MPRLSGLLRPLPVAASLGGLVALTVAFDMLPSPVRPAESDESAAATPIRRARFLPSPEGAAPGPKPTPAPANDLRETTTPGGDVLFIERATGRLAAVRDGWTGKAYDPLTGAALPAFDAPEPPTSR